ncbi:hypothetical protein CCMSSC00406_0007509 [Pleurotus cornucopiae]|uniref:Uncharacterized protein n=1 Tax=Pleurotus cornucopiae TaxID=5321 RepID=A0ACB7J4Y8_PLECO|nr:hypothetical protein CCMSSC00406_0007509 [Pleurotus cornucopiae]
MATGHHGGSGSQQQQSGTWTEPPWSGWIETTGDALLILEAARRGIIPRVTRRLVDSERKMITSGSVFVFDEDESGIKRWTDGFFWSPSRILGNFLLYRETEKKGAGHRGRAAAEEVNDESQYNVEGVKVEGQSLSRPKSDVSHLGVDRQRERTLVGSLTNSYKFKPNGLMKKTFSLTIEGVAQHLISYYRVEDVENGRLRSPSSLPELASLDISPEYLDRTHFRIAPKVEIGIDGRPRYRGEADDIETSPQPITAPLSSGLPLLTDGRITEGTSAAKRNKRFEPYGSPPMQKRVRKSNKLSNSADGEDSPSEAQQPSSSAASTSVGPQNQPPASASYADPNNVAAPAPAPTPYPYGVGVPGYYQVPGYPMPPMYPPGMYPPPPPGAMPSAGQGPSSQAPPQPQQYPYPPAYPPPPGADPNVPAPGYYPYYPLPHGPHAQGPYPGYHPVPWPYAAFTQQPAPQQQNADPQNKGADTQQATNPQASNPGNPPP